MVYNSCKIVKLPGRSVSMASHSRRMMSGIGMGSVLLQTGGPGGASSYSSIDDYISTTGINPMARGSMSGNGVLSRAMSDNLKKLNIGSTSKRKNITMSI